MDKRTLDFSKARILVLGDVMLDQYWHGSVARVSPEAPVLVVKIQKDDYRAGGAANVAINIAALGAKVHLVGIVGNDTAARKLENSLIDGGVRCHLKTIDAISTITKLRVLGNNQQCVRLDFEEPFPPVSFIEDDTVRSLLRDIDVLVLSDYAKGTLHNILPLIDEAKKLGLPVLIDPKSNDFNCYRGATVVTPNFKELEAIVGSCADQDTLISKTQKLSEDYEIEAILVTRGEQGMILAGSHIETIIFPAIQKEVFDVTGAGDTVLAAFSTCIACGKDLNESMRLANLAASIAVGKKGTSAVSIEELRSVLNVRSGITENIVDEETLLKFVKKSKAVGERIVFTNGCFDVLHPGHIAYLEKARSSGDRLVVAVNDDASVRALKGKNRPVSSLEARMTMLSSLKSVDWVVPFKDATPERLIRLITPDILVKGGDYKLNEVVGREYVEQSGGEVYLIDFVEGYSTTKLINKIQKNVGITETA
ncbi:MAG: bifunctional D-glycero-beta-D-manno-heptose-7-phosphate kinase/D-glycero-beta-D-manno-heptose 1-phosphate adenylyltransferase HldE [Gammaproteobacteria bacterium]|nr:bifunctional D-glycero-beta-D-manno-heptose-7-phosphate kinase/D-glycero-beta-D-manno-heptose 1-phosphate adenylyltransferase HldE [Gammaproteobacteria bacterium]